ncbi:GntP family permease [Alloalcanivorax sp. C16-1]|uniref:GntP family permease n=1 Tax=Alloalcanivorax sp. C16-1 TaxID=3390051 RepID=UPI0039705F42
MLVASFLGLFAGLALLVVLTMRGVNIIISAVLCAMLVAVCSGLPLSDAMLDSYMAGFTGFFTSWFPAILLGALFGQLMDDSGAAKAIARQSSRWFGEKRAIMAVVGASAILTYGGVSVFVVGFSVYPIAFELFKHANLPHRFIPGAMVFGSISFTMTSPGSPEVQNLIPTEHFGTTAVAGGMIGVICALTILVLGAWAIRRCVRRAVDAGETFDPPAAAARQHDRDDGAPVPTWAALLPLLVLVGGFNVLSLALGMRPVEALLVAMGASLVLGFVLFHRHLHERVRTLGTGADNALVATANTCAVVGFGAVAALTPAFKEIVAVLTDLPGLEYAGLAMAVTVIAGITGSASGGLGIALPILAPIYQGMGLDNGAMHRISALASGGLDSLPHNGYVVTTIRAICKETHQRAYPTVFIASVLVPSVVLVMAVVLYTLV